MSLRIGFDMDGVLADFDSAFRAVAERLYGAPTPPTGDADPEAEPRAQAEEVEKDASGDEGQAGAEEAKQHVHALRRRRDAVWQTIASTPDFWMTLRPVQEDAVRRIHELALRHRWEVFFLTQRPATEGDSVQRQTQQWLIAQGFDLPSVLPIAGSRGAAAGALRLDYHVDDSARNCIDIKAESSAKPLLIVESGDTAMIARARSLGIGTAASISECLTILEEATLKQAQPRLLHKLAQLVGWD
jgi:hypothetical protein